MRRFMHARHDLIDVHARLGKLLYEQLVDECLIDQCSMAGFIRMAICDRIAARHTDKGRRNIAKQLQGQMMLEVEDDR